MKSRAIILISAASGALAAVLVLTILGFADRKEPGAEANLHYSRQIAEKYRVFSLPLPEKASFAGEEVPMNEWDVRERMDRELLVNTYWQSNTLLAIKRAQRWFPVIEPILSKYEVPDDFKYLAVVESGLTMAVSPSGATGFWQFLEATGKEYELEVNEEVDERYHVEKSTEAACRYLLEAYNRFGSWTMAAASYNIGQAGLERQLGRQQAADYWNLLLNEETSRYVFRILAVKEILSRPDQFGFVVRPVDLYEPLTSREMVIDSAVPDFAVWAKDQGISYKTLKLYNPWLRLNYLRNKERRQYTIRLPA
ncbi:MAG: lytic transglycosylase domain-containing protein [Flavobacteriales bacterium]|jgi:membrane-bound lytic murein transglycosylase D